MPLPREDKERLAKICDFMQAELNDLKAKFLKIDLKLYQSDNDTRRSVERCIENIVNSSLDMAKIILIEKKIFIPDTYREYFLALYTCDIISRNIADNLAAGVKIRNVLAHQYLDIKWKNIKSFLASGWKSYPAFIKAAKKYFQEK